jgi:hypothetical protein
MQDTSATLATSLSAHETGGGSLSLTDLLEIYPADYTIPTGGFDPNDAELLLGGVEGFTYLGLAYVREFVDRGEVKRFVGDKVNNVTASLSNVSRALAAYVQANDVTGKWLVVRVVDPLTSTTLDDSLVIFCGRMDAAGDLDDESASLTATQRFGSENLQFPRRTFGPNDPKGRAPNDILFEGFRFTASQASVLWTTGHGRNWLGVLGGVVGVLLTGGNRQHHSQQVSSHTQTGADVVLPDGFGRVQVGAIYIGTIDIGGAINFAAAVMEGVIDSYVSIRQTNPKFSQIQPTPAKFYGYPGGEGPPGREQKPVYILNPSPNPHLPGDGYNSRTAWFGGFVIGSTPDVDESEAPTWIVLVKAKRMPLPDGTGEFVLEGWTHNPAIISRYLLTSPDYFNEGPDCVNDEQCYETGLHCEEYVIDDSQGERAFVTEADASQTDALSFRSTGVIDSKAIRIGELSETVGGISDAMAVPVDREPFDPRDPPEPTDPLDPIAPTRTLLRERYTCNLTITEKVTAVDFLYGALAETGRLYFKRNGKGRIDICSERPVDHTYVRGAVAAGDSTVKVLDVVPWKTGKLLTQRLLTGAHLITSEVRDVTAAAYTSDGNAVTLATSVTGSVTATRSGATFSGGSSSTPATATVTIGGTPATGNVVTVTINGIAVRYVLDSTDTTATVAAMLARLIQATPKLRHFIKADWTTASNVVTLSVRFGVLTLSSPLALAHTAYITTPTTVPTLSAASGGSLPAGRVYLAYANTNAVGETGLSPLMSITVTAGQKINVPLLALPTGATGRKWYVGKYVNNAELVFHSSQTGAAFSITDLPDSTNALPLDWNTTGEELMRVAASYACNDQDGEINVAGQFQPYPLWQASKAVTLNAIYLPTVPNGHKYKVTTAGTTGATEPSSWTTTPSSTVSSGTAVFTEFGPTVIGQAGLTKSNIHAKTFKWPLGSQQSSINQAKGTFYSAKDDYAATPIEVNDYAHQARTRKVNSLDVDLNGFDNYHQSSRQLNFKLSKLRDGNTLAGWQTGPKAMLHEEGDVVCVSASCGGFINLPLRLEQIGIGPGPPKGTYNVKLTGREYSTLMFSDQVRQHSVVMPTTLRTLTPLDTEIQFLDLPFWRDRDAAQGPGLYIPVRMASGVGSWRGTNVWVDAGDGYQKKLSLDVEAVTGESLTTLADHVTGLDTTSTVRIRLDEPSNTLSSATDDELRAGANLFCIGGEICQARDVALVSGTDADYDLTYLKRGLFGTENETASHTSSDGFTVLDGAVSYLPLDASLVGKTLKIKAVTVNQGLADATEYEVEFIGNSLKPLAIARVETDPDTGLAPRDSEGSILVQAWPRTNADVVGDEYRLECLEDDGTLLSPPFAVDFKEGGAVAALLISYLAGSPSKYVNIDRNALSLSGTGGITGTTVRAVSLQIIRAAENFVEAVLSATGSGSAHLGVMAVGVNWRTTAPEYAINVSPTGGNISINTPETPFTAVGSYTSGDEVRVRIEVAGREVKFYVNATSPGAAPVYVSPTPPSYPIRAAALVTLLPGSGSADVKQVMMTTDPFPSTVVTAEQQTILYGAPKEPMRVRIRQHSGIRQIGYGIPWESEI